MTPRAAPVQDFEAITPNLLCRTIETVEGGGIVVRHLAIAGSVANVIGKEGFSSLLPRDKLGTPDEIRDSCVKFGGALLEAFDLPRGPWDGREPTVPKAWRYRQTDNFQ